MSVGCLSVPSFPHESVVAVETSYLSIKIGMSDRFAYRAPPTAAVSLGVAYGTEVRSTKSKQGQDDTERSDVSACLDDN